MSVFLMIILAWTPGSAEPAQLVADLGKVYEAVIDDKGMVDYGRLKKDKELMGALQRYADFLAEVDLEGIKDKNTRIALLSNAYNVFTLIGVTEAWPVTSVRKIRPLFGFFKKTEWNLAGQQMTLDTLENKHLRSLDSRIHFLINCASGSCPVLVREVFTAGNVERLMDANLRAFLADSSKNRFDTKTGVWELSKIFDWFAEDFGGKKGVPQYIRKVRPDLPAPKKVRFLDYDWSLNGPTS